MNIKLFEKDKKYYSPDEIWDLMTNYADPNEYLDWSKDDILNYVKEMKSEMFPEGTIASDEELAEALGEYLEQSIEENKKKKVVCTHCGYEWETSSEKEMITCPSCSLKFKPETRPKNLPEAIKELGHFFQLTEYGMKIMESGYNGYKIFPHKILEAINRSLSVYPKNAHNERACFIYGVIQEHLELHHDVWNYIIEGMEFHPNDAVKEKYGMPPINGFLRVIELLERIIAEIKIYRDRDLFVELFTLNSLKN